MPNGAPTVYGRVYSEPTAIVTVPVRTAAATVISGRIERSYPNHT